MRFRKHNFYKNKEKIYVNNYRSLFYLRLYGNISIVMFTYIWRISNV